MAKKRKFKNGRENEIEHRGAPRVGCDGTANDYRRHLKHGEKPCPRSIGAWRVASRHRRQFGVWIGDIPYVAIMDIKRKTGPKPKVKP